MFANNTTEMFRQIPCHERKERGESDRVNGIHGFQREKGSKAKGGVSQRIEEITDNHELAPRHSPIVIHSSPIQGAILDASPSCLSVLFGSGNIFA